METARNVAATTDARENPTCGSRRYNVRCERVAYSCSESVKRQEDTVHPPSFQNESSLSLTTIRRTAQKPLKAGAKNRTGSWE